MYFLFGHQDIVSISETEVCKVTIYLKKAKIQKKWGACQVRRGSLFSAVAATRPRGVPCRARPCAGPGAWVYRVHLMYKAV